MEAYRLIDLARRPFDASKIRPFDGLKLQSCSAKTGELSLEVPSLIIAPWNVSRIPTRTIGKHYCGTASARICILEQHLQTLENTNINSNVFPLDWL